MATLKELVQNVAEWRNFPVGNLRRHTAFRGPLLNATVLLFPFIFPICVVLKLVAIQQNKIVAIRQNKIAAIRQNKIVAIRQNKIVAIKPKCSTLTSFRP